MSDGRTDRPVARPRDTRRRFTLLDGMAFVAATAVGVAGVRPLFGDGTEILGSLPPPVELRLLIELGFSLMVLSLPVAAAWTLVLIPLRLARPRPPWRRLARQPGLVAGLAVAPAFASIGLMSGVAAPAAGLVRLQRHAEAVLFLPTMAGLVVLGSWMAPIAGRRWRPEPSWIDRLGRALGVYWIAMALVGPAILVWALS